MKERDHPAGEAGKPPSNASAIGEQNTRRVYNWDTLTEHGEAKDVFFKTPTERQSIIGSLKFYYSKFTNPDFSFKWSKTMVDEETKEKFIRVWRIDNN